MANYYSDYQTDVRAAAAGSLHTRALQNKAMLKVKNFGFLWTPLATELNGEFVQLGALAATGAIVIPETLRVSHYATTTFSVPIRFIKRTMVDGTIQNHRAFNCSWTRVTTVCTVTTPEPHGFATNQQLSISNSSATTPVPNGGSGIIVVLTPTTFTFTCVNSGATSGTLTATEIISGQRAVTWARSTTTLTFTTQGAHGYSSNEILDMTVMSSPTSLAVGLTGVITVTGATTFTAVCTDAGDATGTATLGPLAGNNVPLTSSIAYAQTAVYTGARPIVATSTVKPQGLGPSAQWRKEDQLAIEFGVIGTVFPVTQKFYVEGLYTDPT